MADNRIPKLTDPHSDPEVEAAIASGEWEVINNNYLMVAGYELHREEGEWEWVSTEEPADNPSYDKLRTPVARVLTEILRIRVHPNSAYVQDMMDAIWPEIQDSVVQAWSEGFDAGLFAGREEAEL